MLGSWCDVHNTEMKSMKELNQASAAASGSVYSEAAVLPEDLLGQLACATSVVYL